MSITLHELLNDLYGIKTTLDINKTTAAIGTTAEVIMKANPNRVSFLVVNLSANNIYILPANDVSSTKGIYVAPAGGSVVIQWDRDFILPAMEWWAVSAGAASSILVLENISI